MLTLHKSALALLDFHLFMTASQMRFVSMNMWNMSMSL